MNVPGNDDLFQHVTLGIEDHLDTWHSIRIDSAKKLIERIINGKQVGKWNDTGKFAGKGKGLKEIAKAIGRSEESTKDFAKKNKIEILKKR